MFKKKVGFKRFYIKKGLLNFHNSTRSKKNVQFYSCEIGCLLLILVFSQLTSVNSVEKQNGHFSFTYVCVKNISLLWKTPLTENSNLKLAAQE